MSRKKIAVLSCFGRGHWMAAELKESGFDVTLVDVSSGLGRWTPEDYEGPFGLLHHDGIDASQISRLNEEDYHDAVDSGFCIWLQDGPVDTLGPHAQYLLKKYNVSDKVYNYISQYRQRSKVANLQLKADIVAEPFVNSWFAHIAHKLASNIYLENSDGLGSEEPLPLFSSYHIRRVTRPGLERSYKWLEEKGVKVLRDSSLVDIQMDGKNCVGLEVTGDYTGIIKADQFVWSLTSEETEVCNPSIRKTLFPKGFVKASWVWERYRIRLSEGEFSNSLPSKFLLIQDLFLPWTHDNLCFVQKTVNSLDYDVWVKIPEPHRFRRQYLEDIGGKIEEIIKNRVPDSKPSVLEWPQDFSYGYLELGPARFPVFTSEELEDKKHTAYKNLNFNSPETWDRLDWAGQFDKQVVLVKKIIADCNKNNKEIEL